MYEAAGRKDGIGPRTEIRESSHPIFLHMLLLRN